MKELNLLLLKSFEAHMNWIIPKTKDKNWIEANFAKNHIITLLKLGEVEPSKMSGDPTWSVYGEKVFDTYKEIYENQKIRFIDGKTTEITIERIL